MARRSRQERNPDTSTFHFYNANPKNKITTDCVIRAICTATKTPYEQTLRELVELALETGLHPSDKKLYEKYMERLGWTKHKQPKKADGTKYTGKEFCEQVANETERYLAHIGGHHIVAIVSATVYDIWDSTGGCIGNYWTNSKAEKPAIDENKVKLIAGWIEQAETRQEFINLIPSVREYKKKDKAVFNMLADLLMYEFKKRGFRYTKSFNYDVIYG